MAEEIYRDRMSDMDALLWNTERDPMLRSTIISLMLLDQPPDAQRFARVIERTVEKVPRLRQRVVLDPIGAAPPRWERDSYFSLPYHVRRVRAPGDGSLRDLLDLAEPIGMQAFDKDRPLWELYLVEGLAAGRAALVMKLHHSISDGVGLVRMTSSMVERSREPGPPTERRRRSLGDELRDSEHERRSPFDESMNALRYQAKTGWGNAFRAAQAVTRGVGDLVREPVTTFGAARDTVGSLGRMLQPVSKPLSPLMRERSLALGFDVISLPLEDMKRAGKAVGGTLNDAFVGAVTGGLRLYHEHHREPVDELRMTMPINLRDGDRGREAGNQFAPARFAVPVGIVDPAERMKIFRERAVAQRGERALPLAEEISGVLSRLPRSVTTSIFGSMLKAIDFVTSNVPGPPFPVFSCGAHVERMFGFGPLSGAAVNITLFSYDGDVQLGINTDRAAVPDPGLFTDCLRKGVAEVLSVT